MLYTVYLVVVYQSNTSINSQLPRIYLNDNGTKHYIQHRLMYIYIYIKTTDIEV